MEKLTEAINGRLPPLLRAVANRLNAKGIPDAEIIRRGIRKVAEEEGVSIEAVKKELQNLNSQVGSEEAIAS